MLQQTELELVEKTAGTLIRRGEEALAQGNQLMQLAQSYRNGKINRLSVAGRQKARQAASAAWVECPKDCRNTDGSVKHHRKSHAHIRGEKLKPFPRKAA